MIKVSGLNVAESMAGKTIKEVEQVAGGSIEILFADGTIVRVALGPDPGELAFYSQELNPAPPICHCCGTTVDASMVATLTSSSVCPVCEYVGAMW
jgi:hypothetical protein